MSAIVGAFMPTDVKSVRTESKYFYDIKPIIYNILYNVQDKGKPDYHPSKQNSVKTSFFDVTCVCCLISFLYAVVVLDIL